MKEGSKVPRRVHNFKRDVLPDPMYNSVLVTKLINNIMYDGKKALHKKLFMMHLQQLKQNQAKTH